MKEFEDCGEKLMEEIKIGEYVRNRNGKFGKVIDIRPKKYEHK